MSCFKLLIASFYAQLVSFPETAAVPYVMIIFTFSWKKCYTPMQSFQSLISLLKCGWIYFIYLFISNLFFVDKYYTIKYVYYK